MIKTFNSRDSATSALRKLGVDKSAYNLYIVKTSDGKFTVTHPHEKQTDETPALEPKPTYTFEFLGEAQFVHSPEEATSKFVELRTRANANGETKKTIGGKVAVHCDGKMCGSINYAGEYSAHGSKAAKVTKIADGKRTGVASRFRELILAGKSNSEVWAKLQPEFNLDDSKKSYPGWYRAELRRKGLLAEES